MEETERTRDDVEEHRHGEYDYWHPASRIHSDVKHRYISTFDLNRCVWEADEDNIYDILEAMIGKQTYYIDENGKMCDLKYLLESTYPNPILSHKWIVALSKVVGIDEISVTYRYGQSNWCVVKSKHGIVEFNKYKIYIRPDSILNDARLLIECGLAKQYINYPTIEDAIHLLHVAGKNRHYDLVMLPSGGHIPVDILETDYGVSWETIARIPLGVPRDNETFACPFCGETSFYSGPCNECRCVENHSDEKRISKYKMIKRNRKNLEHQEILRIIFNDMFDECRYING